MDLDLYYRFALNVTNAVRRSGLTHCLASASVFILATSFFPAVSFSQTHDHHTSERESGLIIDEVKKELATLTQTLLTQSGQSSAIFSTQSRLSIKSTELQTSATDLVEVAKIRQQILSSLIEEHPEEVLQHAISAEVRATLPPTVQTYVEQEVEQEGELEVAVEDYEDGSSRLFYSLKNEGQELPLHFAAKQPKHLLTGSQVQVKGIQIGEAVALNPNDLSVETSLNALANASGAWKTLVILVNFTDKTEQIYTLETAREFVFGIANDFFEENSRGQMGLTGDVVGWFTLPLDSTSCNTTQIANFAKQAATAAGTDVAAYDHYVYVFPPIGCPFRGRGSIGGTRTNAWLNGGLSPTLVNHEMGHNLGLYHSHSRSCAPDPLTPLTLPCSTAEYGDGLDTMGIASGAHYNAFQKERLGWLPDLIKEVETDGVYILEPYETEGPSTHIKALKVPRSSNSYYYVEYRQPIGFDGFLISALYDTVRKGVVIHTGNPNDGNSSYLLNMTPHTPSWYDPALEVGQSFSDPAAGITIQPLWANATGVAVSVSFTSQPCLHAAPSITLSPASSPALPAGSSFTYTVSVKNNDGPECAPSGFTLQANAPNTNWTVTFAAPMLTLNPGATATTTLLATSPVSASAGGYTIGLAAAGNSTTGSKTLASATYTIVPSSATGGISVATNKPSYSAGDRVVITAKMQQDGDPIVHAKVELTIKKPDGRILKKRTATNKRGEAAFRLQISRRDPLGTYQVTVKVKQSSSGGLFLSSTSAETNFTVQ